MVAICLPSRLMDPPAPSSPRLIRSLPAAGMFRSPVQVQADPAGKAWPLDSVLSSCGTTELVLSLVLVRSRPGCPLWVSADAGTGVPVMSSPAA